uniref:Shikimate kinase n=1 Tax=uncultured Chloroflexota bacterium TaxID=166587 RepID=H5SFM2_9CHLR|nr:shikimate kinase [uncultured Chloroflexota bacterium]BAL57210.1 shikimate kinase [uncultured Chloroflexota bacterium]
MKEVHLALTGFMGSGKTTVGRMLAQRLGRRFVDTDEVIVAHMGISIPEIFARYGEQEFRRVEAQICQELLATTEPMVIALGGGAVLNAETRQKLEEHAVVFALVCELDEIIRRVGKGGDRPLYSSRREQLEALLRARQPLYARYPQIDTTSRSPEVVAEMILQRWKSQS